MKYRQRVRIKKKEEREEASVRPEIETRTEREIFKHVIRGLRNVAEDWDVPVSNWSPTDDRRDTVTSVSPGMNTSFVERPRC